MGAKQTAPVIFKRRKIVVEGGHHGGAWKVAYADFVTAMMAFFMLMWLLNATTEKQRKGIADYFNPTIPVNRISGGGDNVFGGNSVFTTETLAEVASGGLGESDTTAGQGAAQAEETERLDALQAALAGRGGESNATTLLARHIVTRVTDRGLIVELSDRADAALFDPDTDQPTPLLQALVGLVAEVFNLASNPVAVGAHVASRPLVERENPNWDLSTDRAQAVRALLEAEGLAQDRIARITGFADRQPQVQPPIDPANNRVELVLLRMTF